MFINYTIVKISGIITGNGTHVTIGCIPFTEIKDVEYPGGQ
jgi:hypothetical protein